jgi:hypothetical protein
MPTTTWTLIRLRHNFRAEGFPDRIIQGLRTHSTHTCRNSRCAIPRSQPTTNLNSIDESQGARGGTHECSGNCS